MRKEQTIVKADKNKLYSELKKRGLSASAASKEMGFEGTYISKALSLYGGINERAAKAIEKFFGITRDAYEIKEPAETEPAPAAIPESVDPAEMPDILTMTKEEIHDLLYSAIVKAILDALE